MKTLAFFGFIVGFILSLVFLAATGCGGSERGVYGVGNTCIEDFLLPGGPNAQDCQYWLDQDLLSYTFCIFEQTKDCFSPDVVPMGSDPGGQNALQTKCENKAFACMASSSVGQTQAECHTRIELCWDIPECQ